MGADDSEVDTPRRRTSSVLFALAAFPTVLVGVATYIHAPRPTAPAPVAAPAPSGRGMLPPHVIVPPTLENIPGRLDTAGLLVKLDILDMGRAPMGGDDGRTYSSGAMFRLAVDGRPGDFANGAASGYLAAKRLCERKASSTGAHVCLFSELEASERFGLVVPRGWVSNAWPGFSASRSKDGLDDCRSWTSRLTGDRGTAWAPDAASRWAGCEERLPVLCCD